MLKSGCAKRYFFHFLGGIVDLEKYRFDWVFLNIGLPSRIGKDIKNIPSLLYTLMFKCPRLTECVPYMFDSY